MRVQFGAFTPRFRHISTDVFYVRVPVGSANDVYAKFAVLTITIDIVVVRDRFKIDARSDGNEFVQVFTIVAIFDLSQSIEHL